MVGFQSRKACPLLTRQAPTVDLTLKLKYQKLVVLVYAKKSETFLGLKKKLAEALNESGVLESGDQGGVLEDDDGDIVIPKPAFATGGDDIEIPTPGFDTGDKKNDSADKTEGQETERPEDVTASDIKLALPTRANDGTYSFFAQVKDTDKLDTIAGLKEGDTIAFALDDDEFEIAVMNDEEEDE